MRRMAGWWLLVAGLLLVAGIARAQLPGGMAPQPMPTPEEADRLLAVIRTKGDFVLGGQQHDAYVFNLTQGGQRVGDLTVMIGDQPGSAMPRVQSAHYRVTIWNSSPDFRVVEPLVAGAEAIAASDGGRVRVDEVDTGHIPLEQMERATLLVVLAGVAMGIWRRANMSLDLRKPHVIQACVHSSIFAYWSIYWPGVWHQLPMILLMIAMAYGADAALSFGRFGSWRVGLSPLPVVFSTNLFVWLDWKGACLAMIGAFVCKTFIQRDGKHIFNPSVAGLTLNALATILFPDQVHFGGLFHTLNIAPNMSEWVFLGSLIPLTMFRLLPVSIGGILGLLYATNTPGALRPTLLLMLTLLATDPATTPRSDLGRLLFGFLVGVSYPIYSVILHHLGQPDDFAKILSVPLANLLIRQFDALASRLTGFAEAGRAAGWQRLGPRLGAYAPRFEELGARLLPVPNGLFVAVWIVLFTVPLFREKPEDFEPSLHWNWGTPLVVRDADDIPRCTSNPVFCTPFSFVGELRLWLSR
jgi:hypothetical protein